MNVYVFHYRINFEYFSNFANGNTKKYAKNQEVCDLWSLFEVRFVDFFKNWKLCK